MFFARSARFAIRPLRQLLITSLRWLLPATVLLAIVCCGLLRPSTAVVQNQPPLGIVSAASNEADALAPESLATAYGVRLATQSDVAAAPQPQLAGTTVDVGGRPASLLFVSPEQVNFLVPVGVPSGPTTITVRAADGTISTGTTNINAAAPALFTTGGAVSGFALRVKADGAQSYEPVAEFDSGQYKTKAIDLGASAGDQVFLVFFLSGLRGADPAQVRVILGGDAFPPVFAGAVPGVPGLDQINLLLPRSLVGGGVLNLVVTAPNARPSNAAKIEIGGGVTTLAVSQLSKQTVLAGETLEILGANLPSANIEVLFEPNAGTAPDTAAPDKLTLRVPFGAASGLVKIAVNKQVAWTSPQPISVRTSISGFIQDTNKQGVTGLAVSVLGTSISATTNQDGAFVLPDVGLGAQRVLLSPGSSGLPFPAKVVKQNVIEKRDNQLVRVEINRDTGVVIVAPALAANEAQTFAAPDASAAAPEQQGQLMLTLQPGTTIRCLDGSNCPLTLTPFAPGRTPVDLPPGYFSSSIAQLSPFRATITPGGKLKFPNADNLPPGASVRLFKFEQDPVSSNLGEFRDITAEVGAPVVTASGVETTTNAIRESSYYFVSPQWPVATVIGHVVEADGVRPVRRAIVSARGQSTLTDGNGGFVLRNLPVIKASDSVTLEVSFNRADGTVVRAERANITISANAPVQLSTDIVLPPRSAAGGPLILAPAMLSIIEGETRDFNFIATGLAADTPPTITGPSFATLRSLGKDAFALGLAPPSGSAGNYQITLTATAQNNTARQTIAVAVIAANSSAPIAQSQAVTTDEDTPIPLTLRSNASGTPSYSIVAPPLHGTLAGALPNVTYTPAANYNGTDGFSFKVGSSNDPRSLAVVSIAVRPINDPPMIVVPGPQTVSAGQTLKLTITATDPDSEKLILAAPNAPAGATQNPEQLTPNSWRFTWTPTFSQVGTYTVSFKVTDDAAQPLSDFKSVTVTVGAKWGKSSGPEGGTISDLLALNGSLYAATKGGGVFVSTDNGRSWATANTGIPDPWVTSLASVGKDIFAGTFFQGIYRSSDAGQSWTEMTTGLPEFPIIGDLVVSGTTLYATVSDDGGGDGSGVYRSTTLGQKWELANAGIPSTAYTSSLLASDSTLYAVTDAGIYRSTNQGQSWSLFNNGFPTSTTIYSLTLYQQVVMAGTNRGVYSLGKTGIWGLANNVGLPANVPITLLSALDNTLLASVDGVAYVLTVSKGWQLASAGFSANIHVTVFARNGQTIFAGTEEAGVFKSVNEGVNWAVANSGLTGTAITSMALLGSDLYASTGTIYLGGSTAEGLFRSTNQGQSWTAFNIASPAPQVKSLFTFKNAIYAATTSAGVFSVSASGGGWRAVSNGLPIYGNNLYAYLSGFAANGNNLFVAASLNPLRFGGGPPGGPVGVWTTANEGQNWTASNNGLPVNESVFSLGAIGGTVLAGTVSRGIYRSTNNGQTWVPANTNIAPTTPGGQQYFPVTAFGVVGTTLFAALGRNFGGPYLSFAFPGGGMYRSTDQGQTWTPVNGISSIILVYGFASNGATLYAATNFGIYFTTDLGQNWTPVRDGLLSVFSAALVQNAGDLFGGTLGGGVNRLSNNVQSWSDANNNLANRSVNTVVVKGGIYFAGTLGSGIFRSVDQGVSWAPAINGLPLATNVQSIAIGGTNLFAGTFGQGVYRSLNDGVSWTALNNGLPDNTSDPQQSPRRVNALRVNGPTLLAATDGGVFRLGDVAGSWGATNLSRRALSLLTNGATLYAGTFDDGVYRSSDDGRTWQAASKQGLSNLTVLSLSIGSNGTSLFAGTDAGIYRSDDGGGTWRAVNRDLPTNLVVTSFSTNGTKLYAGSVYGVFLSEDNGENWKQINAGLLDIYATSLALGGDKLIAGTKVGGVFISQIPDQPACVGIAVQPASMTITGNQTTGLSVTPSGNRPFQFQWYQGTSGDFARPVAGQTASTFITPPLTATTNYWVLVTNGCGSASSETAAVIVNAAPQVDLAVTQTATPAQAKPGDNVTFNLTVSNSGSGAAFSATVTDALPSELTLVSCAAPGGNCVAAGNNLTITFASLGPNASAAITIVAKINANAAGATIRNTASVSASLGDSNLTNNTAGASVTVRNNAPAITGLSPSSALVGGPGFALTVNGTNFTSGAKVRWNGAERQTAFGSATQLIAQIPASDIVAVGTAMIAVANPDGQVSGSALFAITLPPRLDSLVRVVSASGGVGGTVSVPIQLVSQGDENALGFSLTFDPATLGNPQAALGSDAAGATINPSGGQAAQGRFGVLLALPAGQRFAAGTRQMVVVTFTIAANTTATTANVGFGDQPVAREVSDINGNVLSANYAGGVVAITRGLEADVAPRPDGNGSLTVTDWVLVGRFASGDLTATPGGEFQRADCAPRATLGDGRVSLIDWVQAGRYAAGIDPPTPAGGPTAPVTSVVADVAALLKKPEGVWPRLLRVSTPVFGAGQTSAVTIELLAQGEENAVSFSLRFDARQWRFVSATAGEDAPDAVLSVNTKQATDGRVGFALALPPGRALEAGLRSLVVVTFAAAEGGGTLAPDVAFSDLPAARELADVKATALTADWMPTAALRKQQQ